MGKGLLDAGTNITLEKYRKTLTRKVPRREKKALQKWRQLDSRECGCLVVTVEINLLKLKTSTAVLLCIWPPLRHCVATDGAYSTETHPFHFIHFIGFYWNFKKYHTRSPVPHLPHNSEEEPGSSCRDASLNRQEASAIAVLSTVALLSSAKHVWVCTARAPFSSELEHRARAGPAIYLIRAIYETVSAEPTLGRSEQIKQFFSAVLTFGWKLLRI